MGTLFWIQAFESRAQFSGRTTDSGRSTPRGERVGPPSSARWLSFRTNFEFMTRPTRDSARGPRTRIQERHRTDRHCHPQQSSADLSQTRCVEDVGTSDRTDGRDYSLGGNHGQFMFSTPRSRGAGGQERWADPLSSVHQSAITLRIMSPRGTGGRMDCGLLSNGSFTRVSTATRFLHRGSRRREPAEPSARLAVVARQ
jgi:hypothetical protein